MINPNLKLHCVTLKWVDDQDNPGFYGLRCRAKILLHRDSSSCRLLETSFDYERSIWAIPHHSAEDDLHLIEVMLLNTLIYDLRLIGVDTSESHKRLKVDSFGDAVVQPKGVLECMSLK